MLERVQDAPERLSQSRWRDTLGANNIFFDGLPGSVCNDHGSGPWEVALDAGVCTNQEDRSLSEYRRRTHVPTCLPKKSSPVRNFVPSIGEKGTAAPFPNGLGGLVIHVNTRVAISAPALWGPPRLIGDKRREMPEEDPRL